MERGWVQGGQRSEPDEEYFLCIYPLPHQDSQFAHLTVTSLHLHQAFVLIYKINQCDKDTLLQNCEDMECTECSDCKESPQRRCKAGFGCFSSFKDEQLEKGCIADDYHYKIICTNTAHVVFCCKEDLCNLNATFPFSDKQPSKSIIRMEN